MASLIFIYMVNKGKIIFVNGYWNGGPIGSIMKSTEPGKRYWGSKEGGFKEFEKAAERFFSLYEAPNTHIYLDGSSFMGGDSDGADRFNKGLTDLRVFDDAYFKRYIENADKKGIYSGANISKIEQHNKNARSIHGNLLEGMDKRKHAFYMVTHSEGGGYGAGLAKFLIKEGWKVDTVVHLSTDEAEDFDTPPQPMTYQLGFETGWLKDYITGNYRIKSGVDKWGIANDSNLTWKSVHGYSKNEEVFPYLEDLRSVVIGMFMEKGRIIWKQKPESTPNGTKFGSVNGIRLNYIPKH